MVVASFLRLVTHVKVFIQPTPVENAVETLDMLFAIPGVEKRLNANDIFDAWFAAAVIQLEEHLITFDSDFKNCSNVLR